MGKGASERVGFFRGLWQARRSPQAHRPSASTALTRLEHLESRLLLNGAPVVAILDTGIDLTDPALFSHIWRNPRETSYITGDNDLNGFANDVFGWNFVDGDNILQDAGNGSDVARAVLAAAAQTVAAAGLTSNVQIMPVRVISAALPIVPGVNEMGIGGDIATLTAGIDYVTRFKRIANVNVVAMNINYGGYLPLKPSADPTLWPLLRAIDAAGDEGIVITIGAGNGSNNNDVLGNWPANYTNGFLLSTAAATGTTLATYSNYGLTTVDLAAPDYTTQGTQFASAQVAGTIAGMAQVSAASGGQLSGSQLIRTLINSADAAPGLSGLVQNPVVLDPAQAGVASLGNRMPVGSLDLASVTTISGWAHDPDAGSSPINVRVVIDGQTLGTFQAGNPRPDLATAIGSTQHGFHVDITGRDDLATGTHTVQVYMIDSISGEAHLLAQRTVQNRAPIGYVDVANATYVAGWAADLDNRGMPLYVRVDVNGVAGAPVLANLSRADLTGAVGSPNHAFVYAMPALAPGFHRIDVNTYDPLTGDATLLSTQTISTNSPPTGWIDVLNTGMVAGWALDPDNGGTPIQVRISIDGVPRPLVTANIARPDVATVFGTANHGFSVALPQLSKGNHTITVDAVDPVTQQLVRLGGALASGKVTVTDFAFDRLPTGHVDVFNTNTIAGWAFDQETGPGAVMVRVVIDGVAQPDVPANLLRTDVGKVVGSPNHGFNYTMPALGAGSHLVEVYYVNPQSLVPVLMAAKILPQTPPTGFVDVLTTNTVSGWAYDADNPTQSIAVRIDIDGKAGQVVIANRTRGDLGPVLGSTNHGFSVTMPKLTAGPHVISVKVIDPFTLEAFTLRETTLVFA